MALKIDSQPSFNMGDKTSLRKDDQKFSASPMINNYISKNPQVKFGQDSPVQNNANQKPQDNPEKKKKNFWTVKNLTNVIGSALWVGILGYGALVAHRQPEAKKLFDKTGKIKKAVEANKAELEEKLGILNKTVEKGNPLYRFGAWIDQWKKKIGDELANNYIYGFGTIVVMPLAIIFSPFGKKDSTQEEKSFAIARQPLSFATMIAMQKTFDKIVGNFMPGVRDSNVLEKENILEKGKLKKDEFGLLKYPNEVFFNEKELDNHFKDMFKKDKGKFANILTQKEIDNIYLYESAPNKMTLEFDKTLKNKKLPEGTKEEIENVFKNLLKVKNRSKMTTEAFKVVPNVIVSQIIGCTMLNVLYGKSMKLYEKHARPYVVKNELLRKIIIGDDPKDVKPGNKQNAVKGGDK